MHIDYYICEMCGEIVPDYAPLTCCICDAWFCENCTSLAEGVKDEEARADFKSCKYCK